MLGWRDDRSDADAEREWDFPSPAATRTNAAAFPPVELLVAGGAPPTAAVGPPPQAPRVAPILSCLGALRWKEAGMPLRSSSWVWAFLCAAEAEAEAPVRARPCACVEWERAPLLLLLPA